MACVIMNCTEALELGVVVSGLPRPAARGSGNGCGRLRGACCLRNPSTLESSASWSARRCRMRALSASICSSCAQSICGSSASSNIVNGILRMVSNAGRKGLDGTTIAVECRAEDGVVIAKSSRAARGNLLVIRRIFWCRRIELVQHLRCTNIFSQSHPPRAKFRYIKDVRTTEYSRIPTVR